MSQSRGNAEIKRKREISMYCYNLQLTVHMVIKYIYVIFNCLENAVNVSWIYICTCLISRQQKTIYLACELWPDRR